MQPINNVTTAAALLLLTTQASASIIINEVDYDQPGSDTAEFIELYNQHDAPISLNNFSLQLINGSNSSVYRQIDLSGFSIAMNDYFVICSDSNAVMNCDFAFTTGTGWLQNGAPDAVALYDGSSLLDSMSYEGNLTGFTEGSTLFLEDSNSQIMSIARIPDGSDTDNNFDDFQTACITPGTMNISGSGNCSQMGVNPVPVPAAVWLFASGLLGIVGVARKAQQ